MQLMLDDEEHAESLCMHYGLQVEDLPEVITLHLSASLPYMINSVLLGIALSRRELVR